MDAKMVAQIAKEAKTTPENVEDYKVYTWGFVFFKLKNSDSEFSARLTKTGRVKKGSMRYEHS